MLHASLLLFCKDIKMDIDEENDLVVSEMPVYLCKELSNQLHLFQFPCRSADSSTFTKSIVTSRIKPQSGIIELDCSYDTKSAYYDEYVGKELALNINVGSKQENTDDEAKLLDKLKLRSQRSILKKDKNCYTVAAVYDGKFCLSVLEDSYSFLPTHEHREKVKKSNVAHSGTESSDDDGEGPTALPVTVKFSHKGNDKTKMSQEQSHHQHLMKTAEEPWCETMFYSSTSSTAMKKMEGLTRIVSRNRTPMMSLNEQQYLNVLVPENTSDLIDANS